jgi:C-terminal processing protease CtpA/Prc
MLSDRLQRIYVNRHASGPQYYVSLAPNVGNPLFASEVAYSFQPVPDAGYRILGLYRFWNIIEYWFPYRDVMQENWDGVLAELLPRFVSANDSAAYRIELMRLSARIHDTHSNTWGDLALRPPRGNAELPVTVRFISGRAVVTGYTNEDLGKSSGLRRGDVIERIGDQRVDSLIIAWKPFYSASNEPTRLRDIARSLTRGDTGVVRLTVERDGKRLGLTAQRVDGKQLNLARARYHDLPGEAFQRLSDEVAYIKISTLKSADATEYIRRASGAKVLVIDLRNYPSDFPIFALGGHLVAEPTEFARFTTADLANPGAFTFRAGTKLTPKEPRFGGKVVILVDEVTQSSAEYHAMAFRAAPGAIVVGSTTAGADGNVSRIPLPGPSAGMISGIGVFYPDARPTQRVGIVPDLEVRPTIEGIRAGRDEVLEAAVSRALGREFRMPSR